MNKKRRDKRGPQKREAPEFEQKIIDLARVTRVMAGGKRMRFRACVAIGDKKGRVAIGLAKGADVTTAISKATSQAKKDMIQVSFVNETIPHQVKLKYKAAQILFKPAKQGKGIIAGGAVRNVLELAGVPNIVAKIIGSNNKVNNVKATIKALRSLKKVQQEIKGEKPAPTKALVGKPASANSSVKTSEVKKAPADKKDEKKDVKEVKSVSVTALTDKKVEKKEVKNDKK